MRKKALPGTESFIQEGFINWLKSKKEDGWEIIPEEKRNKLDEKDWDVVAYRKFKSRKRKQRKFYFEVKGESVKARKDQHMEVALVRGIGQLLLRLQKKTKWWRTFVFVIPESFEKRLREKVKRSYGWGLLGKESNLKVWIVDRRGIPIKMLTYKKFKQV